METINPILYGSRPERCIVTIASLDQWLATVENYRHQWLTDQKTNEKPLVPMVEQLPFHQWQWSPLEIIDFWQW